MGPVDRLDGRARRVGPDLQPHHGHALHPARPARRGAGRRGMGRLRRGDRQPERRERPEEPRAGHEGVRVNAGARAAGPPPRLAGLPRDRWRGGRGMTAAELFVKCLEAEGVDIIFGLPAEENLDLLDALSRSPIRFVSVRHEQGAAFMADVYGRVTGRAGGCLATLGPGATNLATGIADANLDHAPLVAITGQARLERVHK